MLLTDKGFTHDAILHTETELELEIRSLDEDSGDRRAAHNTQFHFHLILQTLDHVQKKTKHKTHVFADLSKVYIYGLFLANE